MVLEMVRPQMNMVGLEVTELLRQLQDHLLREQVVVEEQHKDLTHDQEEQEVQVVAVQQVEAQCHIVLLMQLEPQEQQTPEVVEVVEEHQDHLLLQADLV